MRRCIHINGNKLIVGIEFIGFINSFELLFTLVKNKDTLELNINAPAVGRYHIPDGYSIQEQAIYILKCLTRNESNQPTDMENLLDTFIKDTSNSLNKHIIFSNNGFLPEDTLNNKEEEVPKQNDTSPANNTM